MYTKEKKHMQSISAYAGARKDYVQGGGGNTSVKFDDRLMAIKASGYTLAEITEHSGYVTVDYRKIRQYYSTVDPKIPKDYEKESAALNMDSIVLLENMESKRPSVEVGFHSFLKKCVIHTHSVYANVLCCSEEGRQVAQYILQDMPHVFIPYINPGFELTLAVKQAINAFEAHNGMQPDLIFMENHGLIIHGEYDEKAIALHEQANERIRAHYGLENYPEPEIVKTQSGYSSGTGYLKQAMATHRIDEAYLNSLRLYPDQLVYLGGKMGITIHISGGIQYNTNEKEASTIEETLLGVVYVIDAIKKAGLTLKQMDEKGADFINNWESEKYRSGLIK
jgi:rhamnose utilization protein RhaD (predicted bifunctional aldolase and dehydrogenase)